MNNKIAYKVELLYVKYIPMIVAILLAINNILCYYKIYCLYEIGCFIYSVSLITLIHLYINSFVFKFCKYHRMFIHYITVNYSMNLYDYYIGIPISSKSLLYINFTIMAIFLFLILYFYLHREKEYVKNYKEALITNCGGFRRR